MIFDWQSILAIVSSSASSLRIFLPGSKDISLAFFKDLRFFANENRRVNIEGLFSSIIATIFWGLTYHNQRIDFFSPQGFIVILASIITGPLAILGWSLKEWKFENSPKPKNPTLIEAFLAYRKPISPGNKLIFNILVFLPITASFVGLGWGYIYSIFLRPYEDGVVITQFAGMDTSEQIRFKDNIQINLESLQNVTNAAPKYYGKEVADTDSADQAAFESNQRFVVWGSVYIEEISGNISADVSIRIRDASQHVDTYRSSKYRVEGTTRREIIERITSDLTVTATWTLGLAQASWNPTFNSVVKASQILAQLSNEEFHNNIPETRDLSLLLMDIGYEELYWRLVDNRIGWEEIADIYDKTIPSLEVLDQDLNSALARLYNYYSAALVDGFNGEESSRIAANNLNKAIHLDPQYAMPHKYLAWLNLTGGLNEEAAHHCCEFLKKMETEYGAQSEDGKTYFKKECDEVESWLATLKIPCNNSASSDQLSGALQKSHYGITGGD
jgi:hypothetical protein